MGKLLSLVPHPDHPPLAVSGVRVEVFSDEAPDQIGLDFHIAGPERLIIPDLRPPARTDELWRTTCFELFLQPLHAEHYWEFNVSPSTRWAAYSFEAYRRGRRNLNMPIVPLTSRPPTNGELVLEVDVIFESMALEPLRAGISAVLEEEGGRISYWALAHPEGPPDFHHPDCFALTLPAPGSA